MGKGNSNFEDCSFVVDQIIEHGKKEYERGYEEGYAFAMATMAVVAEALGKESLRLPNKLAQEIYKTESSINYFRAQTKKLSKYCIERDVSEAKGS